MRTIARGLVLMILALTWLIPNTALVFAATQGSCLASDTTKVLLWENGVGDLSDGNDNLWKCGNDANLGDDSHLPSGNCHSPFFGSATWSDCVTSYTGWSNSTTPTICFYRDANYVGFFDSRLHDGAWFGTRSDLAVNDVLTSVLFITSRDQLAC
jgi:hypothetical protein